MDPGSSSPAAAAAEDGQRRGGRNRYDDQKQRDWKSFLRYLENRKPKLSLSRLRSTHVIEYLNSIDSSGKTLIHDSGCPHYGRPDPPLLPCPCPLRQSWGSLDALVGRLRRSCQESPDCPLTNPFGVRSVRNFLLAVKDHQATARGIPYSRKRKSRTDPDSSDSAPPAPPAEDLPTPLPADAIQPPVPTADSAPPLPGSVAQDVPPAQMQICWVRPPVMDNDSTPAFYPVWQYPTMQSLMSFIPPFPYVPTEMGVPKQEDEAEDHPSAAPGTTEEGPSSSDESSDSDSDSLQASPNRSPERSWQRNRYLQQKGRDWNTFMRYLENRQPKLTLSKVRSTHVLEFLKSIEQVGKTLVHESSCPYFGNPNPPAPCACPLRQSWGSLDAMVGRLRSTCEENPNRPHTNPFGVRAVRNYLLQIKDIQATARGIPYSRKRKPKLPAADIVSPQPPSDEVVGVGAAAAAPLPIPPPAIAATAAAAAPLPIPPPPATAATAAAAAPLPIPPPPAAAAASASAMSYASLAGEGFDEQLVNFSSYQELLSTATTDLASSDSSAVLMNGSQAGSSNPLDCELISPPTP